MASGDDTSTAIGAAVDAVDPVASAIAAAKNAADDLAGQAAALDIESTAAQVNAIAERLQSEAAPLAQQLQSLLQEIRSQVEELRRGGLQGTSSAGTSSAGSSAKPGTASPPPTRSDAPPSEPRMIDGRRYSIHAQERMADPTRNVSAPEIETAIARGRSRPGRNPGTTDYYDVEAKIHVVVNFNGDVVTVRRQSRVPGWAKA